MLIFGTRLYAQSPGALSFGTISVNSTTGYIEVPVSWASNDYTSTYSAVQIKFYINVDALCIDMTATTNSVNTTTFSSSNVTVSGNNVTIFKSNVTLASSYTPLIKLYFRGAPGVTARIGVDGGETKIILSLSPPPGPVSINTPSPNPKEYALGGGYDMGGHIRKAPQPYPGTPAECDDGSDLGIPNIRIDFEPYPTPGCFVADYVAEEFSYDGYYETLERPSHYVYKITPDKGNGTECDCGITADTTAGDIKFAQDVLLEMDEFESLQQLLAADFNGSGAFSTLDVALMSACVHNLGVPSGWKPWVFVTQGEYNLANDPPFDIQDIPDLPGYLILDDPLTADLDDINFYGIKRGDILEQDCTECGPGDNATGAPEEREAALSPKAIFFEDRALENGKEYLLPLRSGAMEHLRLLDLALYYDPTTVEVLGFERGAISDEHFVTGITEEGEAAAWHLGWFSMRRGGEYVPENAALLYLRVRAKQDRPSLQGLFWQAGQERLNAAFYDLPGRYRGLSLGIRDAGPRFSARLVGRNPADSPVRVAVDMPGAGPLAWALIDMNGRTIHAGRSEAMPGYNELQIPGSATGLHTILLQSEFGTAAVRFVRQ